MAVLMMMTCAQAAGSIDLQQMPLAVTQMPSKQLQPRRVLDPPWLGIQVLKFLSLELKTSEKIRCF